MYADRPIGSLTSEWAINQARERIADPPRQRDKPPRQEYRGQRAVHRGSRPGLGGLPGLLTLFWRHSVSVRGVGGGLSGVIRPRRGTAASRHVM
jgi:hypothetical protein